MKNKEKQLQAQLVIVSGFVLISILLKSLLITKIAALLGMIFIFIPAAGTLIVKLWFLIAKGLGWVNNKVLLSLVFYLFLFPISLLFKVFNKNTLQLNKPDKSIYKERNHTFQKKDMENIW